jgi:hypothetical protein
MDQPFAIAARGASCYESRRSNVAVSQLTAVNRAMAAFRGVIGAAGQIQLRRRGQDFRCRR